MSCSVPSWMKASMRILRRSARARGSQKRSCRRAERAARRVALPPSVPRRVIRMSQRIRNAAAAAAWTHGGTLARSFDYTPGVFAVEKHIAASGRAAAVSGLIQAPVPPHVSTRDPTGAFSRQVLIAKYLDHCRLYRQEAIFGRAGLALRARVWRSGWALRRAIAARSSRP